MARISTMQVKVGDKFKLKTNSYISYGLEIGDVVTVVQKSGNYIYFDTSAGRIQIPLNVLDKTEETIEEIEKEIEIQQSKIDENKSKLDWMQTTGNKVYDEIEFKVWNTLKTLNSGSTDEQKAKVIAKLIKK